MTGRAQVGEYWDRAIQVDLVGLRADGWIDLGECKWSVRPSLASAACELQRRVASYPSAGRTVRSHLFFRRAPRAPRAPSPEIIVHDLAGLYGDVPGT